MSASKIQKLFLGTVLTICLGGLVTPVWGDDPQPPVRDKPKFDLMDRFDDEQSPLQKGLLDARDKKWRKNIKLGDNPRCSQVVRKYAKNPNQLPKVCEHLDQDLPHVNVGQEECVRFFCCENPSDDLTTCTTVPAVDDPEADCNTLDDDEDGTVDDGACVDDEVVECAIALIVGEADAIREACAQSKRLRTGHLDEPQSPTCAELVFGGKDNNNDKIVRCLEEPFKKCPGSDPDCDPDLKPGCEKIFDDLAEAGCGDLPFVVIPEEEGQKRSSILKNRNGKVVGKRIRTTTVIHYDYTKQRRAVDDEDKSAGNDDSWEGIKISKFQKGHGMGTGKSQAVDRVISSDAFNFEDCPDGPGVWCPANDDRDCYDTVTGSHYRGDQCFDASDKLIITLQVRDDCQLGDELVPCCEHIGPAPGDDDDTLESFYEDDCYDDNGELRTTLVQMIDEDPPEDSIAALNNDGDCILIGGELEGAITSRCLDENGDLLEAPHTSGEDPAWHYDWQTNEDCDDGLNDDGDCMGVVEKRDPDGTITWRRSWIGKKDGDRCIDSGDPDDPSDDIEWTQDGSTSYPDPDEPPDGLIWAATGFAELVGEDCEENIDNDGDNVLPAVGAPETECDGEDDDGDGAVDDGCINEQVGDAAESLCDGQDDDGDGTIDDGACVNEDPPGIRGKNRLAVGAAGKAALLQAEKEACEAFYSKVGAQAGVPDLAPEDEEFPDGQEGCDYTRAMRVHVNHKMQDDSAKYQRFIAETELKKFFHVDKHGRWCGTDKANEDECDEEGGVNPGNAHNPRGHGGNKSYKYEKQRVTVDEVFTVKCKKAKVPDGNGGWTWVDTEYDEQSGTCKYATTQVAKGAARAALSSTGHGEVHPGEQGLMSVGMTSPAPIAGVTAQANGDQGACESPHCTRAMMGFTFAPPVIEWGWRIRQEVCIFGFCFDIFYVRIGYEFNLAAGLRLPVEIYFEGEPGSIDDWLDGEDNDPSQDPELLVDEVLAEEEPTLKTYLQPLDFTVKDYEEFCELHDLDAPWYIANCQERFSFPDFFEEFLPGPVEGEPDLRDGDEFVAQYTIWAGIIVKVFEIPLINWSVGSSLDIPEMCTVMKLMSGLSGMNMWDMLQLLTNLAANPNPRGIAETVKEHLGNCGSFTTPFGIDPDYDPSDPRGPDIRAFPFLNASFSIRADCFDALINGEVITIDGVTVPICTGLTLGTAGASLGVGLGVDASAGSDLITADEWSASGDAQGAGTQRLEYRRAADDPRGVSPIPVGPIEANNFDSIDSAEHDRAHVKLNDFTYWLNTLQIKLSANLEFGGILSPIPDIGSFTLYNLILSSGDIGIPIGQHAGTGAKGAAIELFVENYGLEVDVRTTPGDEDAVDEETLKIKPGEFGKYPVKVRNIGSVRGDFDDYTYYLSNEWHEEKPAVDPTVFEIDQDTDHDGSINEDREGCMHGQDPCLSKDDRDDDHDGIADEDPIDVWEAFFTPEPPVTEDVPAHSDSSLGPPILSVKPFRHPLTRPGIYAFKVTADSRDAKEAGLGPIDPSGKYREGAPDVAFIKVEAFADPHVVVLPEAATVGPGDPKTYIIEGENRGNADDAMTIQEDRPDSNVGGCGLATRGTLPECPYRAEITEIPDDWIIGELPTRFPALPPPPLPDPLPTLAPLESMQSSFDIQIPSDWAGMGDTTYEFKVTATSTADTEDPPAARTFVMQHTVTATLESQTRYIGLEIAELIAEIERANEAGIRTGGLHPIATHPVKMMNDRALERLLAHNRDGAIRAHRSNIRTTQAFIRALDGYNGRGDKIPEPYASDWETRALAIIDDLEVAVGGDPWWLSKVTGGRRR